MKKKEVNNNSLQKAINYSMKIGTFNPIKKGLLSGLYDFNSGHFTFIYLNL